MNKVTLLLLVGFVSLAMSCQGEEVGLWGGKWDDLWPVFLQIQRGTEPDTYQVEYIWLENGSDKKLSRMVHEGRKADGHFEARFLKFKLDGATGMLYGAFGQPRMANLVKIESGTPNRSNYEKLLRESGWKAGAIPAAEALAKIKEK
jgi:hypothetical protein